MDIVAEIKLDHKSLRELLAGGDPIGGPLREQKQWLRDLADALEEHAHAEEATLYPAALRKAELKLLALAAKEEHQEARKLLLKLRKTTNRDLWRARAEIFCRLVRQHLIEEEQLLTLLEKVIPLEVRHELALRFRKLAPLKGREDIDGGRVLQLPIKRLPSSAPNNVRP